MGAVTHATPATGAFGRGSLWDRDPREGRANIGAVTHATTATGASGAAPYGATIFVRACQKWARSRMRLPPQGLSVELPNYGATILVTGVPKMGAVTHAIPVAGAFGGGPYEATNRVTGVPK